MNRAVLWHLQLCRRLADRLGYHLVSAHICAAIDALEKTALSEQELSEMDLEHEERAQLAIKLFRKHGSTKMGDDDV